MDNIFFNEIKGFSSVTIIHPRGENGWGVDGTKKAPRFFSGGLFDDLFYQSSYSQLPTQFV